MSISVRISSFMCLAALLATASFARAQDAATLLEGKDLSRVVPSSFYYKGQAAPTQARNSRQAMSNMIRASASTWSRAIDTKRRRDS